MAHKIPQISLTPPYTLLERSYSRIQPAAAIACTSLLELWNTSPPPFHSVTGVPTITRPALRNRGEAMLTCLFRSTAVLVRRRRRSHRQRRYLRLLISQYARQLRGGQDHRRPLSAGQSCKPECPGVVNLTWVHISGLKR